MSAWVSAFVCVAAGYWFGRARPWKSIRGDAWWYVMGARPGNASKVRLALCLALWADRLAVAYGRKWRGQPARKTSNVQLRVNRPFRKDEP